MSQWKAKTNTTFFERMILQWKSLRPFLTCITAIRFNSHGDSSSPTPRHNSQVLTSDGWIKGIHHCCVTISVPREILRLKKKTLSRISLQIKPFRIVQMKQKLLRSWSIAHARLLLPTMVARLCLAFAKCFFAWSSLLILGDYTLLHLMEMLEVGRMTHKYVTMATHRHLLILFFAVVSFEIKFLRYK